MKDISNILKQYIERGNKNDSVQSISTLFAVSAEQFLFESNYNSKQRNKLGAGNRRCESVCQEIREFIEMLYGHTNMPDERIYIEETCSYLHDKFSKN